jgi:hypothetical protein
MFLPFLIKFLISSLLNNTITCSQEVAQSVGTTLNEEKSLVRILLLPLAHVKKKKKTITSRSQRVTFKDHAS